MADRGKWTLARAARFAREAQIETSAHLRDAEAAREWHEGKLQRALQVHRAQFESADDARVMVFGMLGYRPPYPTGIKEAADLLVSDEARYLAEADLYILTPDMCDVVIAAANSLTVEDLQLIDQDDLPSPTGLVVLPSPLIVAHVGGDLGDVRAFTWRSPSATVLPDPQHPARHHETPSVRISIYHDSHGPVRPDSFVQFAKDAHHRGTPLPPLLLDTIRCLPVRDSDGDPAAFKQHARAARMIDSAVRQQAKHMGLDEATVLEGEYSSGSQVEDTDDTFTARFLYAFWRLCEQRLTRIDPVEPNHAARVAAQRTGVSPDVRVVRLRQIDGESTEGQSSVREWQHRWVVKMHRVRQWYPSGQRHKIIYRGPYVKGPVDKPLLDGQTVRALVR